MPAMAMGMMKIIAKYMIKSMLWVIRIIESLLESLLETLEEKDRPNIERPVMNEAEVEPNENPNDQGNENPVREEEIPNPVPPQANQPQGAQEPTVTLICPLCDSTMGIRRATKGGYFYGCDTWPLCKGYRNKYNKHPGPTAMVAKLRDFFGTTDWEVMEKAKLSGKYVKKNDINGPPPVGVLLQKCRFCGMDPCDHLGRNCPKKNCVQGHTVIRLDANGIVR